MKKLLVLFIGLICLTSCSNPKNSSEKEESQEKKVENKGNCSDANDFASSIFIGNMKMQMIYGTSGRCEERPDGSFVITFEHNPSYFGENDFAVRVGYDGKEYYIKE